MTLYTNSLGMGTFQVIGVQAYPQKMVQAENISEMKIVAVETESEETKTDANKENEVRRMFLDLSFVYKLYGG